MVTETVMAACRRPVQRATDAIFVRTGVTFHAMAPWTYRAALALTLVEGAMDVLLLYRSRDPYSPATFALLTLLVALVAAYERMARRATRFSRAARADPWLYADPAYRVAPSVDFVSCLFVLLLVALAFLTPMLAETAALAYLHPRLLANPLVLSCYVAILSSAAGRLTAALAILVAGCERCRTGRRSRPSKDRAPTSLEPTTFRRTHG